MTYDISSRFLSDISDDKSSDKLKAKVWGKNESVNFLEKNFKKEVMWFVSKLDLDIFCIIHLSKQSQNQKVW